MAEGVIGCSLQARTLLEEVMSTCSHSQECSVLFCDEMSGVVPQLASFILEHLGDQVTGKFQDTYLSEITDGIPQGAGVSMEYLYGLDTTDEGSIGLNLFPMIVEARTNVGRGGAEGAASAAADKKEERLVGMASMFRLLRKCELQINGNLDGIDALLGKGWNMWLSSTVGNCGGIFCLKVVQFFFAQVMSFKRTSLSVSVK